MKVLFAADYREGVPYQKFLAEALQDYGVEVAFYSHYRRVLPLTRGVIEFKPDLLHLHWPEAYFPKPVTMHSLLRKLRYPLDIWLATRKIPMVLTVHNLLPHNRSGELFVFSWMRWTCRLSRRCIAHSEKAVERIHRTFKVPLEHLRAIPHGDLSGALPAQKSKADARGLLGLSVESSTCLIFGAISPYKGILPLVEWWKAEQMRGDLSIVGNPGDLAYVEAVCQAAAGHENIKVIPRHVSDEELALWLDATDCCIFNHEALLGSGSLQLAMARGIPLLLPRHIDTVQMLEPNALVFRFDSLNSDFRGQLEKAMSTPRHPELAAAWRNETAWARIAALHAEVYEETCPCA